MSGPGSGGDLKLGMFPQAHPQPPAENAFSDLLLQVYTKDLPFFSLNEGILPYQE